jgi:hypothetical protein
MSDNMCLFNLFLFTSFWAHEILYSFYGISDHIDAIIRSYSSHRFNFQSIFKCRFEILCHLIRLDQVISLTLSNTNETLDQLKLFLSRFHIKQISRRRKMITS